MRSPRRRDHQKKAEGLQKAWKITTMNYRQKRAEEEKQRKAADRERQKREANAQDVDRITTSVEQAAVSIVTGIDASADKIVASIDSITEQFICSSNRREKNDQIKDSREHATLWVGILTLLAVIFYAAITQVQLWQSEATGIQQHVDTVEALKKADAANYIAKDTAERQLGAMQRQIDEMKAQSALTVSQLGANLVLGLQPEPATETLDNVKHAGWLITPSWDNHGSVDAKDFHGWDAIHFFAPNIPKTFDFLSPDRKLVPNKMVIGPTARGLQESLFVSTDNVERAIAGNGQIVIWGYIEYRDTLPGTRLQKRHWCYLVNPVRAINGYNFSFPVYLPSCNAQN